MENVRTEIRGRLVEAMIERQYYALATTRLGIEERGIAFGDPGRPDSIRVLFEPTIVHMSDEEVAWEESHEGVPVRIPRPVTIRLRYTDDDHRVDTGVFDGLTSRVIQRELDELNGITLLNRVSALKRDMILKKVEKRKRRDELAEGHT